MLVKIGCGGVHLGRLHPKLQRVLRTVPVVWGEEEPVITSTWEGTHSNGSWHYFYRALDFRLPLHEVNFKVTQLREKLGKEYDIVLERTHIHIEYDPKE